ncbi:hypothetical protein RFI_22527, partial [Reticulomyxa filosa]
QFVIFLNFFISIHLQIIYYFNPCFIICLQKSKKFRFECLTFDHSPFSFFNKERVYCHFNGKIKDLQNHLDRSYNLPPIQQNIERENDTTVKILRGVIDKLNYKLQYETSQKEKLQKDVLELKQMVFDLKTNQELQNQKFKTQLNEIDAMNTTKIENLNDSLKKYMEKNPKLSLNYLFISSTIHSSYLNSIDFASIGDKQLICSGSSDKKVSIFDINDDKLNLLSNLHLGTCNKQLDMFKHGMSIYCIEFSSFNYGKYLYAGSFDNNIYAWDVEKSEKLYFIKGHKYAVQCIAISPSRNNGGNGYTMCSGSYDGSICIWDIEKKKQLNILLGHERGLRSVKYESNQLQNTKIQQSKFGIFDQANMRYLLLMSLRDSLMESEVLSLWKIKNSTIVTSHYFV